MTNIYSFSQGWRFCRADAFPLDRAAEKTRDAAGCTFAQPDYDDSAWETVSVPHTFNDGDLFSVPIEDGGSGQRRTAAFYRNTLVIPPEHRGKRVLMEFEGIRQTCYVYADGALAGYTESGVGPFGFDLTPFLHPGDTHCIAVATDNTCTRNIPFCIAETPNHPQAAPGGFLQAQEEPVPPEREGVGFSWNCNDFNPTLGGLTRPVRIHFKPPVHLTLPLYANLRSRGTYIWADGMDPETGTARIHAEAEIRNLSGKAACCAVRAEILNAAGSLVGTLGPAEGTAAAGAVLPELTVVPEDAYRQDETGRFVPLEEDRVLPTRTDAPGTTVISLSGRVTGLSFWEPSAPVLYRVRVILSVDGRDTDETVIETGFRQTAYDRDRGILLNGRPVWLRGYAQRASNEWAAAGIVPQWLRDRDARWIRESGANHIRFMHIAGYPEDIRAFDRCGVICTQPAGDKERETFGRQWDQRVEAMRNVIIAFRNHPAILFWEAGNNVISPEHMREMRLLKQELDPHGGRFMGCRTLNTEEALRESEYVGTMLNRHAARFLAEHGPVTETEYSREEAPRRVWDDFSPPDYDYRSRWLGKGGKKQKGLDFYDLTSEDLALENARGYSEFFHDRLTGASGKNLYSACAALCWTDSAQHGRQSWSENGRMSGRVDAIRVKKQSFDLFRVMHSVRPALRILGHWNYPPEGGDRYLYHEKRFNGLYWEETDRMLRRDPKQKTVYAAASYPVMRAELRLNGRLLGCCDRPVHTFLFPFPGVDVTEPGVLEAVGYDAAGAPVCRDRLETAGPPEKIRLTPCASPAGWQADGKDLAYADVEVTDRSGRVCPLADMRLNLEVTGPAVLLGGYNSGRFDGNGRSDNVIHRPFVFAECGTNRVLLRSLRTGGEVRLRVSAEGLESAEAVWHTVQADPEALSPYQGEIRDRVGPLPPREEDFFLPNREADRLKYIPETEDYCKILVNGQEPDFRGVRAVNRNGSIWGNILCVLERIRALAPEKLSFTWDPEQGSLKLVSGGHTAEARIGVTHLLADGKENLMDGQPYLNPDGIPVLEVNAVVSRVEGASVQYDDKIHALRIEV